MKYLDVQGRWWFRWGAMAVALAGIAGWVRVLNAEPPSHSGMFTRFLLAHCLFYVVLVWIIQFLVVQIPAVMKNGWIAVFPRRQSARHRVGHGWWHWYAHAAERLGNPLDGIRAARRQASAIVLAGLTF